MAQHLGYEIDTETGGLPMGWVGTYVMQKATYPFQSVVTFMANMPLISILISLIHTVQPLWQHWELTTSARAPDVVLTVRVHYFYVFCCACYESPHWPCRKL